jgi:hypothetical protein
MALKIANQKIKQRWLQAMDMWFYWIQDRVIQGHQLLQQTSHSNSSLMNATCLLVHNNKRASIKHPVWVCWNPSLYSQCGTPLIQLGFPHGSQPTLTNDNN